jgi:hypothetical protein
MTPLAHWLVKNMLLKPVKKRPEYEAKDGLLARLNDIHCFEVSDIVNAKLEYAVYAKLVEGQPLYGQATRLSEEEFYGRDARKITKHPGMLDLIFLPAPKTWIEWKQDTRTGLLLEEDDSHIRISVFGYGSAETLCRLHVGTLTFATSRTSKIPHDGVQVFVGMTIGCLVLINSPKIIGRTQHMPHAGLQKKLLRQFSGSTFPLRAWTELKLVVNKPVEIDDGQPHETHLTGQRALHFVRKHIRIRYGQLEYVTSHWRGDASKGMKQTRYKAVLEKDPL